MTWVLAKPFVQDYALIIADVCVTTRLGSSEASYENCLQKIHILSESDGLIVGFSGDVKNAFRMIDDMRIVASGVALKNEDRRVDVMEFLNSWRKFTVDNKKYQFTENDEDVVQMFVAGNHINPSHGGDKHPYSSVYLLTVPDHRPMAIHPHQWHHIGSGSGMDVCQIIKDQLDNDIRARIAAIDVAPEDFVNFLAPKISRILETELEEKGVSPQLTIGISVPGATKLAITYPRTTNSTDSSPLLATTYEELADKLKDYKISAHYLA